MFWVIYVLIVLYILVQAPLLIDLLRYANPKWKVSRLTSRAANFTLITVMSLFFCAGLAYQLFLFLPLVVGGSPLDSYYGIGHLVFSLWIWVNMTVHYYCAVFLHPGTISVKDGNQMDIHIQTSGATSPTGTATNSASPAIEKPQNGVDWNPNRYHYCRVCQVTISYMDHHCPFSGNCAGLHTYAHFYLALFYGSVGLVYASVISAPYFWMCRSLWAPGGDSTELDAICDVIGPHGAIAFPVISGAWVCFNFFLLQTLLLFADLASFDILKNINDLPVFRFILHRIKGKLFLRPDSRVRTLILKQRPNPLYFLLPLPNEPVAIKEHTS